MSTFWLVLAGFFGGVAVSAEVARRWLRSGPDAELLKANAVLIAATSQKAIIATQQRLLTHVLGWDVSEADELSQQLRREMTP